MWRWMVNVFYITYELPLLLGDEGILSPFAFLEKVDLTRSYCLPLWTVAMGWKDGMKAVLDLCTYLQPLFINRGSSMCIV